VKKSLFDRVQLAAIAGLVAVADPVKESTADAIEQLRGEGLRIVMVTGDSRTTAQAVAARSYAFIHLDGDRSRPFDLTADVRDQVYGGSDAETDVARHAGLGVGTAYRRFASRDELIGALFDERMREIVAIADDALAAAEPWEGLVGFLERLVAVQAADRGLKEVLLGSTVGREGVRRVREQMQPRVQEIVRRAHAAGVLREDVDGSDLPLVQLMLGAVAEVAAPDRPDLWRRFLALLLDGLRADGAPRGPLEEPPLGSAAVEDVLCRWRPPRQRP